MCLSNVLFIDSNGNKHELMQGVAQMEAYNNGFMLTGLLGEQKFVRGEIRSINFIDNHSVLLDSNLMENEW